MKILSIVTLALGLLACGGDSAGPSKTFTGTWVGNAYPDASDTAQFSITTSQNGSAVTGVGTFTRDGSTYGATVSGVSTPPNLSLVLTVNAVTLSYAGTYVTSDSVTGTITQGEIVLPLSLKKQ
jgi:type 1 fimbria pilin